MQICNWVKVSPNASGVKLQKSPCCISWARDLQPALIGQALCHPQQWFDWEGRVNDAKWKNNCHSQGLQLMLLCLQMQVDDFPS